MKKLLTFTLLGLIATPALAERIVEPTAEESGFLHGVQLGVGISATGGLDGFVGYNNKDFDSFWAKRFGVRFDFATTKPIKSTLDSALDSVMGDEGIEIGDGLSITDGKMDATHYAAMIDFYPFGNTWFLGGWRLTGGYYVGDMEMSASVAGSVDAYEFELSDNRFRYTENTGTATAGLEWEYRGPYIGTGFDIGLIGGFKIYVDAGVVLTNRAATLALDVPIENLEMYQDGAWKNVSSESLQSVVDNVVSETLSDAQSELDDLKYYPIVKVGFMYRF